MTGPPIIGGYNVEVELTAGITYVVVVAGCAIGTSLYAKRNYQNVSYALLWSFILAMAFEAVSWGLQVYWQYHLYGLKDCEIVGGADCMTVVAFWVLAQNIAAGFLWTSAFYLLMSTMNPRRMWMAGICIGVAFGLVGAGAIRAGGDAPLTAVRLLFFCNAELLNITLLFAACRLLATTGVDRTVARNFLVGFLCVLAVHLYQLYFTNWEPEQRHWWSLPLRNVAGSAAWIVYARALVRVAEEQTLLDHFKAISREDLQRVRKEMKGCSIFPEYYWGLTLPVLALGYGLSGFCLAFLTPNADDLMNRSPILAMYHTYHPCILLDYLPGTLFAQPIFTISVILYQMCVVLTFMRACCYGHLPSILHGALTTVWMIVFSCTFELVFTMNPQLINALSHSIPFIGMQSAVAFFLLSQMAVVLLVPDKILEGRRYTFATYCFLFACLELGGMAFMIVMLLQNYGFGGGKAIDPNVPIDNSDIVFNPLPFLMAVGQIFTQWAYAILTPLKYRPLMYNVKAVTCDEDAEDRDLPAGGKAKISFHLRLRARGWLRAFTIVAFITGGMVVGLNVAVHGIEDGFQDKPFRDQFRMLPGSAVAAVGWVVCAVLLLGHILIVCAYERMRNPRETSVFGVMMAGVILFMCSLLAHASTIPNEEDDYGWFMGSEAFQLALAFWIGLQVYLAWDSRPADPSPGAVARMIDTVVGSTTIVFIMISLYTGINGSGNIGFDVVWIVMVFLYSFTDARKIYLHITDIHIASDAESWVALNLKSFAGVPFFGVDCHGIKDELRAAAPEEQEAVPLKEIELAQN